MSRFFITGLPRSRTAWFAVLTGAEHEPSAHLIGYQSLRARWTDGGGISDSALGLYLDRVLDDFGPRTLLIERDIDDCLRSSLTFLEHGFKASEQDVLDYLTMLNLWQSEFRAHPLVKTVAFDALNDIGVVRDALNWLTPGREYPQLEQMMHMNVQSDRDYNMGLATHSNAGMWILNRDDE